ncbi:transglutaminase family protein [Paenibacillus lentus]|uniref:transglutaminase-like domain-containing protein n=1 Tax=Paenibacillus lentus TaxID=1338368 RepID=UPI003659E755
MASPNLDHSPLNTPVRFTKREAARLWLHRSLVSLLLFALFGESLYPLYSIVVEDEKRVIDVFLCLTGALLLAGSLRLASWLQAALSLILIGGALFYLFAMNEGMSWMNGYGEIVAQDIASIFQSGRLSEASSESRMLLLLIGWSLLVVSVQMLAVGRQTILLFLSVTVIYLLTIEMIFDVPVFYNLVRAAGIGLWIQCYTFAMQTRENGYVNQEPSSPARKNQSGQAYKISAPLTVAGLVLAAGVLCFLLPAQPNQQQPLQALMKSLQSWYERESLGKASVTTSSVSGYGHDDSELGAPLELRWNTYFTAKSPVPVYWRGESKSVYTGRGWLQPITVEKGTESGNWSSMLPQEDDIASRPKLRQTIEFQKPVSGKLPLLSGGIPIQVDRVFAQDNRSVSFNASLNPATGAIYLDNAGNTDQTFPLKRIRGYELTVSQLPTAGGHLRQLQSDDPESIKEQYLQLPESLPVRVRELGKSLVQETNNRYDAAMEIARHLKQNYSYSLNSAVPPADEDFVDRFLFVDRHGYCDHFSTAMVVLLRSNEIPARWVKGFTPGERSKEAPDSYTISYADAHAWVEVYFPGKGWVPFDPTPGYESVMFASPAGYRQLLPPWFWNLMQTTEGLPKAIKVIADHGLSILRESAAQAPILWTAALLAVWPVIWFAMWISRNIVVWYNLILLWQLIVSPKAAFPDQRVLLHAADRVWQQLYRTYGYKPEAMTAREYVESLAAKPIENFNKLEEFVRDWETLYYGGLRPDRTNSRNFLELCRNLALRRG